MFVPDLVVERGGLGHFKDSQLTAANASSAAADHLFRRLVCGAGFLRALGIILALDDTGGFSAPAAQVIKLGTADLAAAYHLDRVDHRRIEREHPLDAFAVGNLAHGEVFVEPAARAADAHALVGLNAAAVALDHLDVDEQRVAGREVGDFLAGGQAADLLLLELFDEVHGKSPSRLAFAWSMISSENRYPLFGIML